AQAAEGDGEERADDREGDQQLDERETLITRRSAHRIPVGAVPAGVCVAGLWVPVAGVAGTCVALAFAAACSRIADVVRSVATSTSRPPHLTCTSMRYRRQSAADG